MVLEGAVKWFKDGRHQRKIVFLVLVFLLLSVGAANIYREFMYAKDMEISGKVIDIQWKTDNHQLPRFIILNDAGKKISLSQFTIALKPSDIKVGDRIQKKEGSEFCIINGRRVLFSLY